MEGVHTNENNQITWHTGPGCNLTANDNFTGTVVVRYFDYNGWLSIDWRVRAVSIVMSPPAVILGVVSSIGAMHRMVHTLIPKEGAYTL